MNNALINNLFNISTFKNNIVYTPNISTLKQLEEQLNNYQEKHFKAVQENNQLLQCHLSDLIFETKQKIKSIKK